MGILSKIFGGGGKAILDSTSNLIDNIVTSKEERGELKNKFTGLVQDFQLKYQEELTKRHSADMNSDSWWSKNIRPLSLAYLLGVISILAVTDGNIGEFEITTAYIDLFKSLLLMVFSFYFGSRAIEKVTESIGKYNLYKDKKNKNRKTDGD